MQIVSRLRCCNHPGMAVQNRIVKVQKRNRALVRFDEARIGKAILRAASSIGGFQQDFLPGINDRLFTAFGDGEYLATFLSDAVVVSLNGDPHHLIANFPPTIEKIQDEVLHVLRSYGFQNTADSYECYRWGRHWMREGAVSTETFVGNGFSQERMKLSLDWSKKHLVHTVEGVNEAVRSGKIKKVVHDSLDLYEKSLDEAADKVMERINNGDKLRLLWVSGPSSSGKTTTTVKLTQRLEKHGLRFLMLNLDDYFWSLVEKPIYSFKEGRRAGSKPVKLESDQILLLDCLHGLYPPMTEGIDPSAQFKLYIETQNVLLEGDGKSKRLTKFTDVRLIRRMLRDALHRNHSPLKTILHWHYVRAGELFSIIPLQGLADHIVNGGFPFDLPALKPFFSGKDSLLPHEDDFRSYAGFLDAKIRYHRVKTLLDSVEGLSKADVANHGIIPGDAVVREFVGGSTIKIPHNE